MSSWTERPLLFDCAGAELVGVLTEPARAAPVGVVIVVGGPQYRVGSHRQFVLLARALADAGVASLRFDLRGMGDSQGPRTDFNAADADLQAAIDALCGSLPHVERVVLWGLCDGASACALYRADPRVAGLALVNPWVRTETLAAQTALTHYYGQRILNGRFWRKLGRGGVNVADAIRGLWRTWRSARPALISAGASRRSDGATLPQRVVTAMARRRVPMLVALSGRDAVAAEFRLLASSDPRLSAVIRDAATHCVEFADANHTFSTARASEDLTTATLDWLRLRFAGDRPAVDAPVRER